MIISPELISYHDKAVLEDAIMYNKDYIATCNGMNLFDYIENYENLQKTAYRQFFHLTKKKRAYLITNEGVYSKNNAYSDYVVDVKAKRLKVKLDGIYTGDFFIGEAKCKPLQKSDSLLSKLLSHFRRSKFSIKTSKTFTFDNPVSKFPFEILYNVLSTNPIQVYCDKTNRLKVSFKWEHGHKCMSPKSKIEGLLIPMTISWITGAKCEVTHQYEV